MGARRFYGSPDDEHRAPSIYHWATPLTLFLNNNQATLAQLVEQRFRPPAIAYLPM